MNKRERREQYLSTRRTPEYLAKRKSLEEQGKILDAFFTKHPGFYDLPMNERYAIGVREGLIDPAKHPPEKFGIKA